MKIGFTIGKFAPFHKGHQYLIETALKEMDKVVVVVYETDLINVPIMKRADWIKKIYPDVEIKIAKNPPSKYGLDKDSVKIQMEYLTNIIEDIKPTHFYSSEPYGKCVAEYMNIVDRRVDTERKTVPIHASNLRTNLEKNINWINDEIYQELKKEEVGIKWVI